MDIEDPSFSVSYLLLICFGLTVVIQCSFFAVAYLCQIDKVTDLAGSLNFILLAIMSLVVQNEFNTRAVVVTCMQVAWAIRLGSFLLLRVLKRGKDERFDKMRANCTEFFGFWIFQILWVFLVSMPVVLANSNSSKMSNEMGERKDIIGLVVWAAGMVIEYAADMSKSAFADDPRNKGKLLRSGVWKYSRHPNYFGEILCWVGVAIICSANFGNNDNEAWYYYASCVSPVFTFLVLMFLSGVPLAEDRYDKRFGLSSTYLEYKHTTSPLILLPPSVYGPLPQPIKRWCLFELEMYSRKLRKLRKKQDSSSADTQDSSK